MLAFYFRASIISAISTGTSRVVERGQRRRRPEQTGRRAHTVINWKKVTMAAATAGGAEGGTELNAFDNALLAAGIGNINLIKGSSILPPEGPGIDLPKIKLGALIPTAYAAMTTETPGETGAPAAGYALPPDPATNGVLLGSPGPA